MESQQSSGEQAKPPPQQWVKKDRNLVTYGPTGGYYGRAKISKTQLVYESLNTKDRSVADRRLLKFMERIRKARNKQNKGKRTLAKATFGTLFERFKTEYEADTSLQPASRRAKINSLIRIENSWPEILAMKPSKLRKYDVERWVRRLSTEGTQFTPPGADTHRAGNSESSVKKSLQILTKVQEFAVEEGLASENVVREVAKERRIPKGEKATEPYIPTSDELADIEKELSIGFGGSGRKFTLRLLCFSGARIDEARNLLWSHVDFEKRILLIHGTKTTTSDRTLPMNIKLVELLRDQYEKLLEKATREEIGSLKILPVKDLNKQLKSVCKKLMIPKQKKEKQRDSITNHSLRHYFATTCLDKGVPIPTVSNWLGHSDGGALLLKVYNHYLEDKGRAAADLLDFEN